MHIDVYCTGTDDDDDDDDSSSNEFLIYEGQNVKVTHTQAKFDQLPRGFHDDVAFLKKNKMNKINDDSEDDDSSSDNSSFCYPSQLSSYSRLLRDFESAASSKSNFECFERDLDEKKQLTDHMIRASVFGPVVNTLRKPGGHHVGPPKNPSCSCQHCKRYFDQTKITTNNNNKKLFY